MPSTCRRLGLIVVCFSAMPYRIWDLSSLTSAWTHARAVSSLLDCQGSLVRYYYYYYFFGRHYFWISQGHCPLVRGFSFYTFSLCPALCEVRWGSSNFSILEAKRNGLWEVCEAAAHCWPRDPAWRGRVLCQGQTPMLMAQNLLLACPLDSPGAIQPGHPLGLALLIHSVLEISDPRSLKLTSAWPCIWVRGWWWCLWRSSF